MVLIPDGQPTNSTVAAHMPGEVSVKAMLAHALTQLQVLAAECGATIVLQDPNLVTHEPTLDARRAHWPGAFDARVYAARRWERILIEKAHGPLASDTCVIVTYGDALLGWADDYGTFHHMTATGLRARPHAEALVAAAIEIATNI